MKPANMETTRMELLSTMYTTPILLAVICGLIAPVSAEPMHAPTKMLMAKAESVGMSSQGLARIEDVMNEHVEAGHIQGGVTIVARRGKVVHFSTHGEMDAAKGRAMETDAMFVMASSTKPVLGVAAMMAIEEGLMSPRDPVSKYIPEFADVKVAVPIKSDSGKGDKGKGKDKAKAKAKAKGKGKNKAPAFRLVPVDTPVTIHHLLTHTAGFKSSGLGWRSASLGRHTKDDTLASYVPKLAQVPLDFQPGTQWGYSMGLDIVARIIEIVTKTPFDKFLQERIFDPLKMNNTYFNIPSDKAWKCIVLTGIGAEKGKDWLATTTYISASAGLSSTAEDFLHFEQMLLNGGELFGHRLLSPASVKMMSSNQTGDLFATAGKVVKGMGFGYTVGITLDSNLAADHRGSGAFGWRGAAGSVSWTDPENELVAVYLPAIPRGGSVYGDFENAVYQAIID